jgi:hypothetical protein
MATEIVSPELSMVVRSVPSQLHEAARTTMNTNTYTSVRELRALRVCVMNRACERAWQFMGLFECDRRQRTPLAD